MRFLRDEVMTSASRCVPPSEARKKGRKSTKMERAVRLQLKEPRK